MKVKLKDIEDKNLIEVQKERTEGMKEDRQCLKVLKNEDSYEKHNFCIK